MANSFTESNNTAVIDTVLADATALFPSYTGVNGAASPGMLKVGQVEWVGAVGAGDECIVTDANDEVLLHFKAQAANEEMHRMVQAWWARGFKVPTIDSGVLYIHFA